MISHDATSLAASSELVSNHVYPSGSKSKVCQSNSESDPPAEGSLRMTPVSPSASPTGRGRRHSHVIALGLGAFVFVVQAIFWHLFIQHDFFPTGDEFSLLAHSTRVFHASPMAWFTHGFADYFNPYPDLALPYSNFLRPLDNVVFYLNSLLFTTHWSFYLLANYLLVSIVVVLAFYTARAILELPLALSLLVAAATIVSPAFSAQIFYRPSFAFDYLAALFALLTAALLARGRILPAWFAVWCAVFSKETGFSPPASPSSRSSIFCAGCRSAPAR